MKKLAVIGTGMAGMSAAYFMQNDYDVTVFEKNNYIGGHTNTIDVNDGEKDCPMDTGFMVFNETTYPYMVKLFKELDVPYKNTDMSFSVRNDAIDLEFNGSSLGGIFAQKKNIFNLKFVKMIREILKFNADAPNVLQNIQEYQDMSIGEYLKKLNLSDYFLTNFLAPMSSAVWSTPMDMIKDFPAKSLVRFFKNHGFVGVNTQLQWKTVIGGSREYRNRIIKKYEDKVITNSKISSVKETENGVTVVDRDKEYVFDKVIIATHGDEALELLAEPTSMQKEILSKFSYQENIAVVHTDESVMPHLRKNWSSWNFMMREGDTYTVYYMNRLQGVSERQNFFININGEKFVDQSKIIDRIVYHHPIFDVPAMQAQEKMDELNKQSQIHFTGSYYRYGFHEDALLSSVNLCSMLLGRDVL